MGKRFLFLGLCCTVRRNAQGKNFAYDLRPVRFGTPRHQENFAQHDFSVSPLSTLSA